MGWLTDMFPLISVVAIEVSLMCAGSFLLFKNDDILIIGSFNRTVYKNIRLHVSKSQGKEVVLLVSMP